MNSDPQQKNIIMHHIQIAALSLLIAISWPVVLHAADGDLDSTYGTSGKNSVSLGGTDNVYGSFLQSDGKMIVVGGARPGSPEDFGVARFNANGSLDTGFGVNGIYTLGITPTQTDRATGVGVQSDGKIIVGGYTRFASGNDNFAVIRLTAAGVLDTSFGSSGITQIDFAGKSDRAFSLKVMSDDRIVMAGWSSLDGFDLNFAVVRLTSAGALDATLDGDGKVTVNVGDSEDNPSALAIQSDGKIVLGGHTASSGGNYQVALLRLNVDGSRDTSFDSDGVVNFSFPGSTSDYIYAIALQSDGKIVASGLTTGTGNAFVARFTTSGALDTTFNTSGYRIIDLGSTSDQLLALTLQSDGKIVAGGLHLNGSFLDSVLVRVTSSGALDTTFGTSGLKQISLGGANDRIKGLGIQSSGKIVAAIETAEASGAENFGVARFEVASANAAPTDIALSNSSVNQSAGANAVVGTLSSTDSDATDTHTYSLSTGTGDTNNGSFNISGSSLRANNAATAGAGIYSVRIQTDDGHGGTFAKAFTITVLDNINPSIISVAVPANATYRNGQSLDFTVRFNEPVPVTGTPVLTLTIDSTARSAGYVSGSGSSNLLFRYTVQAAENDANGIAATSPLTLNGGTIQDAAGNNATLTFTAPSMTGVLVDALAPQLSSIIRLTPGQQTVATNRVVFEVTFSEDVGGVSPARFIVSPVNGSTVVGTVTSVIGGPRYYDVTVNITSGTGEFRLDVPQPDLL